MPNIPLIIDHDADFDDLITIIWLLHHPFADIKLITYCGCGWSRHPYGSQNLLDVLSFIYSDFSFATPGESEPMLRKFRIPDEQVNLTNQLWGLKLPRAKRHNDITDGVAQIIATCKNTKEPLSILCLSPPTNIAKALSIAPDIKDKIKNIYITGGCPSKDNMGDRFAGNECLDIEATEVIYGSGIPIIAVPNSTSHHYPINADTVQKLTNSAESVTQILIAKILSHANQAQDHYYVDKQLYLWDILTAFTLLYPDACKEEVIKVNINKESKKSGELIKKDEKGKYEIKKVVAIDKNLVFKTFYDDFLKFQGSTD